MFRVKILGAPAPLTADQKKKADEKAKKAGKEAPTRERLSLLTPAFTVETDSPAEVTKVIANTIAKQSTAAQSKVVAIEVRRVGASDPSQVSW